MGAVAAAVTASPALFARSVGCLALEAARIRPLSLPKGGLFGDPPCPGVDLDALPSSDTIPIDANIDPCHPCHTACSIASRPPHRSMCIPLAYFQMPLVGVLVPMYTCLCRRARLRRLRCSTWRGIRNPPTPSLACSIRHPFRSAAAQQRLHAFVCLTHMEGSS